MLVIIPVDIVDGKRDGLLCDDRWDMFAGEDNEVEGTDDYWIEWVGDLFCLDLPNSHWDTFEMYMVGMGWCQG